MTTSINFYLSLPHHNIEPYSKDYWTDILKRLTSVKNDFSIEAVEGFILKNIEETANLKEAVQPMNTEKAKENEYEKYLALARSITASTTPSLVGLRKVANELTAKHHINFEKVMHVAFQLLSDSSSILCDCNIPVLTEGSENVVELTRLQVACLLSHMLCCTLLPMRHNKYWVSFEPWLIRETGPSLAYLLTLLNYFQEFNNWDDRVRNEVVRFHRAILVPENNINWSKCGKTVVAVDVRHGRSIGDQEGEVEVDFANKDVGFGVTGTQEELLFGISPEMCVAVLMTTTLQDSEAFLIEGVRRIGQYEGKYGVNVEYSGLFAEPRDWKKRVITAVDALEIDPDLSQLESLKFQLREQNLLRELNKAYIGFRSAKQICTKNRTPAAISSGGWGCGAFGGDKHLKVALQIMAASASDCDLFVYNNFSSLEFAELLSKFVEFLSTKEFSVSIMWRFLIDYASYLCTISETSEPVPFIEWVLESS